MIIIAGHPDQTQVLIWLALIEDFPWYISILVKPFKTFFQNLLKLFFKNFFKIFCKVSDWRIFVKHLDKYSQPTPPPIFWLRQLKWEVCTSFLLEYLWLNLQYFFNLNALIKKHSWRVTMTPPPSNFRHEMTPPPSRDVDWMTPNACVGLAGNNPEPHGQVEAIVSSNSNTL